ncbi:Uncharacterised protein [Salmonella enterica subsp. enterica serovar Bovismorbificans]|uniref:Uncharacterized protein n=1 Tax=Salmonella enterica subsp. enterica serovar Bovismorbificans TaxID=58097 RepID=A0A655BP06_SALET|nr:Uncharacterised protein [Salmonella enterica subsp. enterica serovar Bovismorbificans]CNT64923.1 Uncharacterised protein [Salmonella enterica subsp. enterica serovar Bovismorbificans]CNT65986.1 Uncharacterised protein [Salmonella enterica subsp. enterica serovar Bovismorbificans]CPR41942.1 Uncharacterised protein [Salmonella enterica subsp. enterica serovar Bovismorbificans]CPR45416.1 Uncharacterised protein [Salmonella enterica subsp. enterica serovar Bovismorbificans]
MVCPNADSQHDRGLEGRDNQRRHRFTNENLPGGERRDQQLIQSALFTLAGDGQRSDDHHANSGDHGDQRGHYKPLVVQIRVIPVAYHQFAIVGLWLAVHQCLLILLDDLLQIIGGDLRAVGVTSIKNELHRRRLEGIQIPREIRREAYQQQRFLRIDSRLDLLRTVQQ